MEIQEIISKLNSMFSRFNPNETEKQKHLVEPKMQRNNQLQKGEKPKRKLKITIKTNDNPM